MNNMKLKIIFCLVLSLVMAGGSGCVSTADDHSQGGVPFLHDTIHAKYERPPEAIAEATKVVLSRNGKLLLDNIVNNTFKARINERTVYVRITKVDSKITAVEVQARTSAAADIDLAAEIDKQIALQLTVTQ